ncbi:MAG: ABC transporter permease [Firmicutes bacterium]|nr:ABC transporter permease [Bacillota bacterium]
MKNFLHILALLKKDLLESLKNYTVIFAVMVPILLSLIFSFVSKPKEMARLRLIIIDRDKSKLTRGLNVAAMAYPYIKIIESADLEGSKKTVNNGDADAIMVFPDNFDKLVQDGGFPKVDIWVGISGITGAQALKSELNKVLFTVTHQKEPPDYFNVKLLYGEGSKDFSPLTLMLPYWILFTVLLGFMVTSSSVVEEKEKKTLTAIRVTPCGMPEFLAGKVLLGTIIVVGVSLLILILNGGFVGNLPALFLLIFLGAVCFSLFGVFVGLMLPSQTSVSAFGTIMMLFMFMPIGMATINEKIRTMAKILPTYYLYNGLNDAMFTKISGPQFAFQTGYICLFALLLFAATVYVLKNKEEY